MSAHNDFPESAMTPWYPRPYKPVRVGVYRTSREDITALGSSYSFWDGTRWQRYKGWCEYHDTSNFVWRGLNRERRVPLEGGTLE